MRSDARKRIDQARANYAAFCGAEARLARLQSAVDRIAGSLALGSGTSADPFHVGMDASIDLRDALEESQ